ncbi:hypothetical protein [Bacteroides acidifaciens]|uniref:hypothetical protein n=1 Tax=Bacteroides acidifaciens TaxID=85831 RepID=UPI00263B11A7|nr:hypothetical protein [Bacteroides acidifaciens]
MDFPKIKRQIPFAPPRKEDIKVITKEEAEKMVDDAIHKVKSGRFSGKVVLDSLIPGPIVTEPAADEFNLTLKDPEEMRREFEDAKTY